MGRGLQWLQEGVRRGRAQARRSRDGRGGCWFHPDLAAVLLADLVWCSPRARGERGWCSRRGSGPMATHGSCFKVQGVVDLVSSGRDGANGARGTRLLLGCGRQPW